MQAYIDKAATLIEALPYIQSFRGATVVVKVGGSVMESADNLDRLLSDIAFMSTVGMKVALVHGGGKAISRGMEQRGIVPRFVQGLRVTDGPTIEVVESVLKTEVNADVVRRLRSHGANARPLARHLYAGSWRSRAHKGALSQTWRALRKAPENLGHHLQLCRYAVGTRFRQSLDSH